MYIGQAVIASGMADGELLVVEPEQMQDRRVKVVNVDAVLADRDAELVRRSIREADPPPVMDPFFKWCLNCVEALSERPLVQVVCSPESCAVSACCSEPASVL